MTIQQIIDLIEIAAPPAWQEAWDNSGLQVGDPSQEATGVLLTLDVTEDSVSEAVRQGANLILSHHPLLFKGLKRLTGSSPAERIVAGAIRSGVAIYSAHTNMDSSPEGVNFGLARKLGLQNLRVLAPRTGDLVKLAVHVPHSHADAVREALFAAGAGRIGTYDSCSYNTDGFGTFRAGAGADPFVGSIGELHREPEVRIGTLVPRRLLSGVVKALYGAHPYEVPAYDIFPVELPNPEAGLGCIGELPDPVPTETCIARIAEVLKTPSLRHSEIATPQVRTIALCGGSGSEFIGEAIRQGADIYLTGDVKYHDFQRPEGRLTLVDGGHFETEVQILEIFSGLISEKFPNFAVHRSLTPSNPVRYYINK